MALPSYINPTTMMTPYVQARLAADGVQAPADAAAMSQPWLNATPQRQDFMVRNPNYNPSDPWSGPEMIQDPSATATPTAFSNSAGTTGVLNPFGLTQNNASAGYYGAPPPTPAAATPTPAASTPEATPPPASGPQANTTSADDNRPPDQRGFEGNYNPTTGMTGYATPKGVFMMDQGGNWFSQDGSPVEFDQSQSGAPPEESQTMIGRGTPPDAGGVDPAKDAAAHPGMTLVNGQWFPGQTTPSGVQPPPAGGTPGAQSKSPYQTGVTSSSIDPKTGQMRYDPTNPNQFATQDAANSLATRYGGTAYGLQLQGPGMGFSAPMQQVRFGNGNQINAGLATQALGRPEYGSGAPGSYGDYMVSRDVNGAYGGGYDQWARSQPGFLENPRLANTGPNVGNQYQQAAPNYYQPPKPTSTAQAGAQQYQQYQAPSQQSQGGYGSSYGQQQYQGGGYQQPQGGYYGGSQGYQYQGQYPQQSQQQAPRQQVQQGGYQGQQSYYPQQQYQQGSQSYYGGGGGNTRQPGQSYYQQPSYTAGSSSGAYQSPYGGGYVNYSSPTQSKAGGYMQTGKTTF